MGGTILVGGGTILVGCEWEALPDCQGPPCPHQQALEGQQHWTILTQQTVA